MSSTGSLLFDTHAFLAFFNREEGSETLKNLMDRIECGEVEGFVAAITLTELAYIYARKSDTGCGHAPGNADPALEDAYNSTDNGDRG